MFDLKKTLLTEDIKELYVVTPIQNVAGILANDLLCHHLAADIDHKEISNPDVQKIREEKVITLESDKAHVSQDVLKVLWDYVCMFIQPYNAMVFTTRSDDICIMRLDPSIMEEPGVLITDRNASCHNAKFFQPHQWSLCDENAAYIYEKHSYSTVNTDLRKSVRQAEVLCPTRVKAHYIKGFFVKHQNDANRIQGIIGNKPLDIMVNSNIFFLDESRKMKDFIPLSMQNEVDEELLGLASLNLN